MPELPDVTVYLEALEPRVLGRRLEEIRLFSPFLVRTVEPPLDRAAGRQVVALRRIGKRIVLGMEGGLFLVLHLMIAGRLRWRKRGARPPGKAGLAAFDFPDGTLLLTEASPKKRASLHVVRDEQALERFARGGLEPLGCSLEEFAAALTRESHTVKRALTDPSLFSGIGNAYSDEILFHARLSPLALTRKLTPEQTERLWTSTREVLEGWIERLRAETGAGFPEKVTAFRDGMAVHGRYRRPCPVCGRPVQRIRYASNECNYCAQCQNEGRILADRSLSRLLKGDWPRTFEELEERLGTSDKGKGAD